MCQYMYYKPGIGQYHRLRWKIAVQWMFHNYFIIGKARGLRKDTVRFDPKREMCDNKPYGPNQVVSRSL